MWPQLISRDPRPHVYLYILYVSCTHITRHYMFIVTLVMSYECNRWPCNVPCALLVGHVLCTNMSLCIDMCRLLYGHVRSL